MLSRIVTMALAALAATSAAAQVQPFPPGFQTEEIATNGTTLHVRVGGKGPAVVLLHGYGETGDMWAPLAADLARGSPGDRAGPARPGSLRQAGGRRTTRRRKAGTSPACWMR